jgi:hypothetical protein
MLVEDFIEMGADVQDGVRIVGDVASYEYMLYHTFPHVDLVHTQTILPEAFSPKYQTTYNATLRHMQVRYPIYGKRRTQLKNRWVRLNFYKVDNIKFAGWVKNNVGSGFEAVYRDVLLSSVVYYCQPDPHVVSIDGRALLWSKWVLDFQSGLWRENYSAVYSKEKRAWLDEYTAERELVSVNPDSASGIFFGYGVSHDRVATFEDMLAVIQSQDFMYPKKRQAILRRAAAILTNNGHAVPKVLKS